MPSEQMPPDEEPGREAWRLLFQLLRTQRRTLNAVLPELKLNPAQIHLLLSLCAPAGATMSELADELAFDASYITGLVDRLEDRGLVMRVQSPQDRRVKRVALTEAGIETRRQLKEELYKPPAFLESLSIDDQRLLRDLFRRALSATPSDAEPVDAT